MTTMTAPAHYLRGNEMSRHPRVFVFLDTEAVRERTDAGETQTWRVGVTCCDRRTGDHDHWAKPEWAVHDTPRALWEWVDARCKRGVRVILVAHNLSYDLRIAEAFIHLPAMGWTLDRIRLDAEQAQCRWRDNGRTLQCIDSMSWFPVALQVIGDELGIEKPELPADDDTADAWVQRCTADVFILRAACLKVWRWCHDHDLGNWQPTGAGQAWSAWRHRFLEHKILVGDDPRTREVEREAVWSGRAEAWRWGKHRDGPYTEYDLEACYLRIMRDAAVPIRHLAHVADPDPTELRHWREVACVLARVEVETDVPVVPARGPHGILWPTGRFETTVWAPELDLLDAHADKVRVIGVDVYRARPALQDFARWLWPIVTGDAALDDPLIRRVAKHWSRAFIGRFGVRYTDWEPWAVPHNGAVGLERVSDRDRGTTWRLLSVGVQALREGELREGENAVPAIMGWVMSETRRRLWSAMTAAGLSDVLHVDTDGLLVTPAGAARLEVAGIEGLRVKGVWRRVEVVGPRQLVYEGRLRAPGVPRRAVRTGRRSWAGETWQGLTAALSAGTADRVEVRRRTVRLTGTDRRRAHLPHGRTRAFTVEGG